MQTQTTHVRIVREWCQSLGVLTAVSISRAEAELKLAAYLPMLMQDFPDAAFTPESLNAVARQCVEGFPPYPVLAARLSDWWRPRRPTPPALAAPPPPRQRPPPTDDERAAVSRLAAEAIAAIRSSAQPVEGFPPYPVLAARLSDWWRPRRPKPRYLTPAELDLVNPLPEGKKRAP